MGTAALVCLILTIIFGLMTLKFFVRANKGDGRAVEGFGVFIYGPVTFVCGLLTTLFWFLS